MAGAAPAAPSCHVVAARAGPRRSASSPREREQARRCASSRARARAPHEASSPRVAAQHSARPGNPTMPAILGHIPSESERMTRRELLSLPSARLTDMLPAEIRYEIDRLIAAAALTQMLKGWQVPAFEGMRSFWTNSTSTFCEPFWADRRVKCATHRLGNSVHPSASSREGQPHEIEPKPKRSRCRSGWRRSTCFSRSRRSSCSIHTGSRSLSGTTTTGRSSPAERLYADDRARALP